jgi:DNA-binding beta-propeller fold protein YncE
MNKLAIFTAAALTASAAVCAFGGYVYEGLWGTEGSGNGQFRDPTGVAAAPDGNVYVSDEYNDRVFQPYG